MQAKKFRFGEGDKEFFLVRSPFLGILGHSWLPGATDHTLLPVPPGRNPGAVTQAKSLNVDLENFPFVRYGEERWMVPGICPSKTFRLRSICFYDRDAVGYSTLRTLRCAAALPCAIFNMVLYTRVLRILLVAERVRQLLHADHDRYNRKEPRNAICAEAWLVLLPLLST